MAERLAPLFHGFGPHLLTAILASLPVTELRGAIPFAYFYLDLPWYEALGWSLIGNLLPVPFILYLLDPVQLFLRRWKLADRFFEWLFARTRRRGKLVEKRRAIGLAMFVAIPLPVTGAWTGAVAAYVFGIGFVPALIAICIGVTVAGGIVTTLCVLGVAFT